MTSSYDLNFPIDLNHIDQDHHHLHQPEAALIIPEDHNSPNQQFNYLSLSHISDNNKPPVVDAASSSSSTCSNSSSSYSSSISILHPAPPPPPPPPPPYNFPIYSQDDHRQSAAAAAPAGICYKYDPPKLVVDLDQINKMELHQYENQATAAAAAPGVEIDNMISKRREIIDSPVVKWKVRRLTMKKKKKKKKTTTTTDHNKRRQKQTSHGDGDDDNEHAPESDINVHVSTVNATVRVCADCNTTKTPLWRSGPRGPKSLCNACGIRQRKARRAAILAANNTGSGLSQAVPLQYHVTTTMRSGSNTNNSSSSNNNNNKRPKSANDKPLSSLSPPTQAHHRGDHQMMNQRKKICFEEFAHSLTKNLTIQQVLFPQEEKDAAILLMALSCDGHITIPD